MPPNTAAPNAVYTSDLQRARDTAAALAQACGAPLREDTGLRERHFGHFEGATFEEIAQRWPEDALRWLQQRGLVGNAAAAQEPAA